MKGNQIPKPSVLRLCKLYNLLDEIEKKEVTTISSKEMGDRLGVASHNLRKDIGYLVGDSGTIGSGYETNRLKELIEVRFGFNVIRHTCIIGLDTLGTALLNQKLIVNPNFKIIAGFDYNINRLETIKTDIKLYPTHEITEVVKNKSIELAVITDPSSNPDLIVERLIDGGIKGILNFSSLILTTQRKDIVISNIDLIGEFRNLVALMTLNSEVQAATNI